MFGDWNGDGDVGPGEAWVTLVATGVIEDGDIGDEEDPEDHDDSKDGHDNVGCGYLLAILVGVPLLVTLVSLIVV